MSDVWMKTLREENFFGPIIAGEEYLLEEPAWRDASGDPQFTVEGAPKGRPSWQPRDLVVLYVGGRERTAGLLEIGRSCRLVGEVHRGRSMTMPVQQR
jgi:hypothetical protein